MNRTQAIQLMDHYKNFPKTDIFSVKPFNYPLFYLLECFAKGWEIVYLRRDGENRSCLEVPFEEMSIENRKSKDPTVWRYCALNPDVTNYTLGFVQEDLFARYVGKLYPLKTSRTTWTYFPSGVVEEDESFFGKVGNSKFYLIQIDLNTTDIIGKRNTEYPWHYLHQTIEWKPWNGQIPWQGDQHVDNNEPDTLRDRFNRIRMLY